MEVINLLKDALDSNKAVAMATIIKDVGSSPRSTGSMMLVGLKGILGGSIGGGALEYQVIDDCKLAIEHHESVTKSYPLESLNMECGGDVEVFIQVYPAKEQVLLVGGGHICQAMIPHLIDLGFHVTVIDERENIFEAEVFSKVSIINKPLAIGLNEIDYHDALYSVIVSHGHLHDEEALGYLIHQPHKYIGMIGSSKKIQGCYRNLMNQGVSKEQLKEVYAPIGLALGGQTPQEIGLGIIAEIQSVRYEKEAVHMKDIKLVNF